MNGIFRRASTLPLGVDIGTEFVSIVASDAVGDGFTIRRTETLDVPFASPQDLQIAETLQRALAAIATAERRCVLAAPSADVVTRVFRVPPGMRRIEAERAATLEADSMADWPGSERLVALDPIPGNTNDMLVSVARLGSIERIVAIARAAGLRPVAVDLPACAWRRAIRGADALLDCSREHAELIIFGEPIGVSLVFPARLIDERLASSARAAFADARRDGIADVARLEILGTRLRYESLEALFGEDGYVVAPVRVAGLEAPPWTLAFGLASWSIAPHGFAAS